MRKHKFIDKHPVGGALVFALLMYILRELITLVPSVIHALIGNEIPVICQIIYMLIGVFGVFAFYKWWFSPEFKGVLTDGDVKGGLVMLLFMFIYWVIGVIAMNIDHTFTLQKITMPTLLVSLTAGFVEELIFRHAVISTILRNRNQKDQIMKICLISSVVFGLVHSLNIFSGANMFSTICQVITTFCIGIVFATIFMNCGSLWPSIIFHAAHDIYAISTSSSVTEQGVVTGGIHASDIVDAICCIAMAAFVIIRYMTPERRAKIVEIWNHKWSKDQPVPVEPEAE